MTTARDYLRQVTLEPLTGRIWTLKTWDTGKSDWRGQTRIGYELIQPDGAVLFAGEDFAGSPMDSDDSDATLRSLLKFLTLRPGDTDREYFDNYTTAQTDFAQSFECEAMAMWACDDSEIEVPEFIVG